MTSKFLPIIDRDGETTILVALSDIQVIEKFQLTGIRIYLLSRSTTIDIENCDLNDVRKYLESITNA